MLLDFPDNEAMRACPETIYQAIYVQGRGELRKDLAKALRKGRAARRPRNDGQCRRPRFREPMVMISDWYAGLMGLERDGKAGTRRHQREHERIEIADLVQAGEGVRAIARRLGRSPTTLRRELRRNAHPRDGVCRPLLLGVPDNEAMRACHETTDPALYVLGRGELRKDLAKALRKGRAARRPSNDGQCRRPRFRDPMVMIS